MNLELLGAFAVLSVFLAFSPGPAVLTAIAQGVRHGWRRSVIGTLGLLSGNALYFTLSALGVGAFIASSPRLYGVLRWGGIAYLTFTALRHLFSPGGAEAAVKAGDGSWRALYVQGLTTQLSNPKAIVFFVSILAPFIDTAAPWPPWLQVAVLGVTSVVLEFPVLVGYGFAASHGRRLLPGDRAAVWQGRIAAACLLAAATWLALRDAG